MPWSSKPCSMLAPSPCEQMEVTQFLSCSFSQADPQRQTESCNFTLRTHSDVCWSLGEQTDHCQAVLHSTAIGSRDCAVCDNSNRLQQPSICHCVSVSILQTLIDPKCFVKTEGFLFNHRNVVYQCCLISSSVPTVGSHASSAVGG